MSLSLLFLYVCKASTSAVKNEPKFVQEKIKLSLIVDYMIVYLENLREITENLVELMSSIKRMNMYKVNISVALIYIVNNEILNLSDSNSKKQIVENEEEISSLLGE